jgi:hypothetical protein
MLHFQVQHVLSSRAIQGGQFFKGIHDFIACIPIAQQVYFSQHIAVLLQGDLWASLTELAFGGRTGFDSGAGQLIAFQAFQFQPQQWTACPFNYNSAVLEINCDTT